MIARRYDKIQRPMKSWEAYTQKSASLAVPNGPPTGVTPRV